MIPSKGEVKMSSSISKKKRRGKTLWTSILKSYRSASDPVSGKGILGGSVKGGSARKFGGDKGVNLLINENNRKNSTKNKFRKKNNKKQKVQGADFTAQRGKKGKCATEE